MLQLQKSSPHDAHALSNSTMRSTVLSQVGAWEAHRVNSNQWAGRGEMENEANTIGEGGSQAMGKGTYPDARGHVLVGLEQLRDLAAHLAYLHLLAITQQLDPGHRHPQRRLAGKSS